MDNISKHEGFKGNSHADKGLNNFFETIVLDVPRYILCVSNYFILQINLKIN